MVTKNTQPEQVELDWGSFASGSVDVLIHWNIAETTGTTDDGTSYTQYEYEEARIRVPLPAHARSQATAQEYLDGRYPALLMLAGADVIPNKLGDIETALLDLAEVIL